MNYYKLRKVVMMSLKDYLTQVDKMVAEGLTPPKFSDFQNKLMLEHGATEKMIKHFVERLLPNCTVKDDKIVRINE